MKYVKITVILMIISCVGSCVTTKRNVTYVVNDRIYYNNDSAYVATKKRFIERWKDSSEFKNDTTLQNLIKP